MKFPILPRIRSDILLVVSNFCVGVVALVGMGPRGVVGGGEGVDHLAPAVAEAWPDDRALLLDRGVALSTLFV